MVPMVDISMPDIMDLNDDPFACNQCSKSFLNVKLLQQHQQMFHSDKSFVCEICSKAFRFRSNLAEHRSVHTALKPYVCKFCGKSSRLKGNLTKHILKHHKKEQCEGQIGKDDIIIKKEQAAQDFLEKSLNSSGLSLLPKEDTNDKERSILISLGLDYNNSLDLRDSPEPSESPENGTYSSLKQDFLDESSYGSPMPNNTVGGETSLAALIASVSTPPPSITSAGSSGGSKTRCLECGKHFRKSSQLNLHMTLNHGHPPPESTASSSEEKTSEGDGEVPMEVDPCLQGEIVQIKTLVAEIKAQQTTARTEQLLSGLDTRVGRLEKQVEMALNSIYTLVQLQTGMNSSVTRFKDETQEQLKIIKGLLTEN